MPSRDAKASSDRVDALVAPAATSRRYDRPVLLIASDAHRAHDPADEVEAGHRRPMHETPDRVDRIRAALDATGTHRWLDPDDHGRAPIDAVHDPAMVDFLETAWAEWTTAAGVDDAVPDVFLHPGLRAGMGPARAPATPLGRLGFWCFETTTPIVAGTYGAARAAVDLALTATDRVLVGERFAYALCRPPGHHAGRSVFGGYCFFNNAAIAAQHAVARGIDRVAVLDVDYHHGNGTQQIFYERADVFYASLHGDPDRAYPFFTGHGDETGAGAGAGTNLNLPLGVGCDDGDFVATLDRALEAIDGFGAEIVIVSLGLDPYRDDPICDLAVTTDGFRACGARVAALDRPTIVVQEGGYATDMLGSNVAAWLAGLETASGQR